MLNFRSPSFLLFVGGTAFGLSLAVFLIAGKGPTAWAFMLIALPPLIERQAAWQSALIGSMMYDEDTDRLENLAYRPAGTLLRCIYLLFLLVTDFLVGPGGYDLLPDNAVTIVAILGPFALYLGWAGVAYWRSIQAVARQQNWKTRRRG